MAMDTEPRAPQPDGDALADAVVTYFQPFYNLRNGQLQGLEALARREPTATHPDTAPRQASDLPAGLLAEAQARGEAREVDLHVLEDALGHFAHLQGGAGDDDGPRLIVRINVGPDTVAHPHLVPDVTEALRRHDVPADRLLVDIPTGLFRDLVAADDTHALDRLRQLQELEISFCLDGFTADDLDLLPAASSVPVDIITLHPHVVAGDAERLADLARAVQDEGLPVVAAGVETPAQLATVRDLGFEWAQGFLVGEPAPAAGALTHPTTLPDA